MPVLGLLPPCGCPIGLGGGVVPNPGVENVLEYSQGKGVSMPCRELQLW